MYVCVCVYKARLSDLRRDHVCAHTRRGVKEEGVNRADRERERERDGTTARNLDCALAHGLLLI